MQKSQQARTTATGSSSTSTAGSPGFLATLGGALSGWFGSGTSAEAASSGAAVQEEPTDFSRNALALFSRLDKDGDGYVTAAEIDAAMKDSTLTPEQGAVVATLKGLRDQLEELSNDEWGDENDGVTVKDLQEYQRTGSVPEDLRKSAESTYGWGLVKINGQVMALFPNGRPSVGAIQQGNIGDCYFLAAVGSLAAQNPQAIVDMITDNGNGTFTVAFPNGKSATVPAPTAAEIARFSTSGADGLWLPVLEKAYGQVRNDEAWFGRDDVAQDAADGGAQLSAGTSVFSPDGSTDTDLLSLTGMGTTRDKLTRAFAEGRVVTAGIAKELFGDGEVEGLPAGHAYSVTAFDPETGMVTVRNPWGRKEHEDAEGKPRDGTDDGTFTVSVEEFDRLFSNVSYAGSAVGRQPPQPAPAPAVATPAATPAPVEAAPAPAAVTPAPAPVQTAPPRKAEVPPEVAPPQTAEVPATLPAEAPEEVPAQKPAGAQKAHTVTVQKGESLWRIAARELGDGRRWRELYDANRQVVGPDPNRILPGQVLQVPLRDRKVA